MTPPPTPAGGAARPPSTPKTRGGGTARPATTSPGTADRAQVSGTAPAGRPPNPASCEQTGYMTRHSPAPSAADAVAAAAAIYDRRRRAFDPALDRFPDW